jgi:hypothetical protein
MPQLKSTSDVLKDQIYTWLCKDFSRIETALTNEMKTELDGVLWVLAGKLADAGMWKHLQDTLGIPDARKAARL